MKTHSKVTTADSEVYSVANYKQYSKNTHLVHTEPVSISP